MPRLLRIATRRSALALWQAEHVAARLRAAHAGLEVALVPLTTRGDRILDAPLAHIGGKGLFIKELETALLEERADIAVHSMKDVPVALAEGLTIAAVLEREDPRDAFVSNVAASLDDLPLGARVGSSSLRRQCQLRARRPDLALVTLRGNVDTRLAKLDAGEYDAVILAAAGLKRLGLAGRIGQYLAPEICLPAIAQGTIGIECRAGDEMAATLVAPLNHEPTAIRTRAERALNRALMGGCQVPIAGYAELDGRRLRLRGLVASPDGTTVIAGEREGAAGEAERLGEALAAELLERGAARILRALGEQP